MIEINEIRKELQSNANPTLAVNYKRYLKSQYNFYGLRVPMLRKIAKKYKNMSIYDAMNLFEELWNSGNHEEMNLGIFLLQNYKKQFNLELWHFLMKRIEKAKSWDHIDILCSGILGYILRDNINLTSEIKKLSESNNPWMRRASIITTCQLIRQNKIDLTILLAEKLVYDEDIYVQKGAGWMLREAGKKNRFVIRDFILNHLDMKNAAFSYATEKMMELREARKNQKDYEIFEEVPFNFNPVFEGVGCIVDFNGKVIILKRQKTKSQGDMWGLPSGKIEKNEKPEDAMQREIFEETGLKIEKEKIKFIKKIFVKYKDYDFIYYIYSTKLESKPEIKISLNEHQEFKWIKPETSLKMKNIIQGLDYCVKLVYGLK